MPVRLNPHAPAARPEAVDMAGTAPAATQAPATEAHPSHLAGPLRRAGLFASCFGFPTQSRFSQPATGPTIRSASKRKKQLDAAIDRWAETQRDPATERICSELKVMLHSSASEQRLDLHDHQLSSFPGEMGKAKALQKLDLNNNQLTSFPGEMGKAKALQELDLSNNQLTSFPGEMGQAKALWWLQLSNNRLTSFPGEMGKAKALVSLTLSHNQLTSFPGEMGALEWLDLSNNQLTSFPGEMGQAKALWQLDLSNNRLTSFPGKMRQAKALQTLKLCNNQLRSFPGEMWQAKALQELDLSNNQLTSFPGEMWQAKALRELNLNNNQLTSFPSEMGQAKALQKLDLNNNQLTSFPGEMGQAKALYGLFLSHNQLTSFPGEMGQAKALEQLDLRNNRLRSFPGEMGQAKALQRLYLHTNQLSDMPVEIAQLRQLRHLDLRGNQFTRVPLALLDLPTTTEIDLRDNPLPDAEIVAVRETMAQRRAARKTAPQLLLPALAGDAGELREAAANDMNVHTAVLTSAFKKRLDDLAGQFPAQLTGTPEMQRAQMKAITARLTHALDDYVTQYAPDQGTLRKARSVADLMFKKGQGEAKAYYNEFQHSSGHVLAYTFLGLEAQWMRTPEAHQAEARQNGMAALINALGSGSGMCDTRLCEEVMQTIGLPLSGYAQTHPEVVAIEPPRISAAESHDATLAVAQRVLSELLDQDPGLTGYTQPPAWRAMLAERMQCEHPKVLPEALEKCLRDIESDWAMFHDVVVEQRAANGR